MSSTVIARLTCAALLSLTVAAPAFASGSSTSSASSAASESVGSVSDSFGASSNSSSGETKVTDGDYRVIEVAALEGRPGMVRLTMQALDREGAAGQVTLNLPQGALKQRTLAAGDVVSARQRAYGYEFAHADTHQAFFLVLADEWYRDLQSRPVTL